MKRRTKGIIVSAFFAVILVTSTLSVALNSTSKQNPAEKVTITGTPADNFPDEQRPRYCQSEDAKSTPYITEYKITTDCTQPLAVTVDQQGKVWFAQTNTGNVAQFDPTTKQFTEFKNPSWPEKARSQFWGMDYSYDGNVWYTDDANNAIWKFSTSDGSYTLVGFPTNGESLPQHVKVLGNNVIVNDFYGGKIAVFDTRQTGDKRTYQTIPSPLPGSFVAGFDVDSHGAIWYTNWILRQGGALLKFDYQKFLESGDVLDNSTASQFSSAYDLPASLGTPIGLSVDQNDNVWIADTFSNGFFKFDPNTEEFTKYVTPVPRQSSYGNSTGVIRSPISGPYWTQVQDGKLFFNEQTGNAIGVFDINNEKLTEYRVPSQNPNWADCGEMTGCGVAQVFNFKATGDKIWFTEWVENNLGVVDLSKPVQTDLTVDQKSISIVPGQSVQLNLNLDSASGSAQLLSSVTSSFDDLTVQMPDSASSGQAIPVKITASDAALSGTYKLVLSARTADVTVSQYVTVTVQ